MLDIFTRAQWDKTKADYEAWWRREREQPVINLSFYGKDSGMKRPEGLITTNLYQYDENEPAERIAEKLEYIMRSQQYEFNGYPHIWIYFGAIYSVEFIGCRPHIRPDTVWFEPDVKLPPDQLHIAIDPKSVFLPREKAIRKAIEERFGGGYVISYTGGGGSALDMIGEFYGLNDLSLMLYDEPEEIHRLMAEITDALTEVGNQLLALNPHTEGHTRWNGILAPKPWISTQCDYCAMIGPDHFDEFVMPDLMAAINRSPDYNYYHLDGPGEIIHMDKILDIPNFKCMQWVAGPTATHEQTMGVYRRIHEKGRNMHITGDIEMVREVADLIGTTRGIYWFGSYPMSEYDRVMKIADDLMSGR